MSHGRFEQRKESKSGINMMRVSKRDNYSLGSQCHEPASALNDSSPTFVGDELQKHNINKDEQEEFPVRLGQVPDHMMTITKDDDSGDRKACGLQFGKACKTKQFLSSTTFDDYSSYRISEKGRDKDVSNDDPSSSWSAAKRPFGRSVTFHLPAKRESYTETDNHVKPESCTADDGHDSSYNSNHCGSGWFDKMQIQEFYRQARRQAKWTVMRTKDDREQHDVASYLQEIYHQSAKTDTKLVKLLRCPPANRLLATFTSAMFLEDSVRGLEPFLHACVKEQRRKHVHDVLTIQRALHASNDNNGTSEDPETISHVLRTRSLHTSRASRVLSRLFAHADVLQVTQLLEQELMDVDGR